MVIYFADKVYKNLYKEKERININNIKEIIINIYIKYNIKYVPLKVIYLIIYLEKNKFSSKLMDKILNKVLIKSYIKLTRFMYKIIQAKWLNIIYIAKNNNVENEIFDYFFKLYNLYLNEEQNMDMYKYQTRYIFNMKIAYYKQFKKFILSNIYITHFYIPIIFSKINKLNIKLENIYEI